MPIYFGDEGAAGKIFNQTAFVGVRRLWRDMGRTVTAASPADFAAAAKEIVRIDREEPARVLAMQAVDDVINHHPETNPDRRFPNQPFPLTGATPKYQRELSPAIDEAVGRLREALGEQLYPGGAGRRYSKIRS